jgi:hypothetical protein
MRRVVASISQSGLLPGTVSIFPTSVSPTEVPAMGVHKPAINRIPAPIEGGGEMSHQSVEDRLIASYSPAFSAEPVTTRIRSNPMPVQPPANVEYSRRKDAPPHYLASFCLSKIESKAQSELNPHF